MQRNVLEHYLTKVSAGDKQYVDKLCQRLAERLLWVPVSTIEEVSKEGQPIQRCELVTIKVQNEPFLPVFTTGLKLRDWLKATQVNASVLSILGRDLCGQLEVDLGLLINDGAANSVELTPETAWKIAGSAAVSEAEPGQEEEIAEEAGVQMPPLQTEEAQHFEPPEEVVESDVPYDQEIGNRTVEVVVDLKKVQELVRTRIIEQASENTADQIEKISSSEGDRKVIELTNVVEEGRGGLKR